MSADGVPDSEAEREEKRRVRELRTSVDLTCAVLRQGRLSRPEADALVVAMRRRTEALFPGKGPVFDLVLAPRFQRIIDEVLPVSPPARVLPFRDLPRRRG